MGALLANTTLFLIKFFDKEAYADQFMAGSLYLNRLSYFKKLEAATDGRPDSTEAVAMWWQPDDLVIDLDVPGVGKTKITKADLAAPVSMAFEFHDHLHLLCMYAMHTGRFGFIDGHLDLAPEELDDLKAWIQIDERCFEFGKFAVITPVVPFLERVKAAFKAQGVKAKGKLVKYYDDEIFHGEIALEDIPFSKQKRFAYQREFRLCVNTGTKGDDPLTIQIGDIHDICGKVESAWLNTLFEIKTEAAPAASLP